MFGTPIAGAIFAIEVLVLGRVLNNYLFPVLISSIVSYKITHFFGVRYHHYKMSLSLEDYVFLYLKIAAGGIIFGLIALLFIEVLTLVNHLATKLKIYKPLIGVIGGCIIIGLVFVFDSTIYLGLGTNTINESLQGNEIPIYAFLIKILFVAITLGFGGSGGVITPIFFIGTTAGLALGQLFHLDLSIMAAIGLVSLLAASTNTPIASILMTIELFGQDLLIFASNSIIISYVIAGHRSIYPTQVIGGLKSNLINLPLNKTFSDIKLHLKRDSHE